MDIVLLPESVLLSRGEEKDKKRGLKFVGVAYKGCRI